MSTSKTSGGGGGFGGGFLDEVDWDKYARYRPQYPASLEKLIIDYQRAHSNAFRLAHDVGSGSGVFAPRLAEYFQHVHVSDINHSFLEQAKRRLESWFENYWWKARFTFSITPAEKADEPVAKGSVDLVTLMWCSHWTDQDAMVRAVARSLTPNGTLAVLQINPAPTVVENELLGNAVREMFAFWGQNVLESRGGKDSLMETRYLPQGNAGVESIPLPEGVFIQDVTKRIGINAKDRGKTPYAIPGQEDLVAPSRADPQHRRYEYTSLDAEGEGWRYEVEGSWFRGLMGTLEQEDRLHLYENRLMEIEKLVKDTSMNGMVEIEWTVSVLLATRK